MRSLTSLFLILAGLISLVIVTGCSDDSSSTDPENINSKPVAIFEVNPGFGSVETIFEFDASSSSDAEDENDSLKFRWDFDGDGSFDTPWENNSFASYQYEVAGSYEVKLEVKDTEGAIGSTTSSLVVSQVGGTEIIIDASYYSKWVYLNIDEMQIIDIEEPQNSLTWDIAFKRYQIKTNSGTSGKGKAGVICFDDLSYEAVTMAPKGYYCQDDSISITMLEEVHYSYNKKLFDWYSMSSGMPPELTSRGYTYVVRKADGESYFKLKIDSYYNPQTGESGFLTINIEPLLEVSDDYFTDIKEATVDAFSEDTWVYYDFETEEVVEDIDNPEVFWDIAFKGDKVKTNSGTSGSFGLGATLIGDTDDGISFEELRDFDGNKEFSLDEDLVDANGNHFSGNPVLAGGMTSNGADSSEIYAIQTSKFNYVKLQFIDYDNGKIKFRYEKDLTATW